MRLTGRRDRARVRAFTATLLGLVVFAGVSGCGDDEAAPSALGAASQGRALSAYDLVVVASAENNPLYSDLYGITVDPLSATRITTDKRISSLDAFGGQVVVAAADGPTDRLAFVADNGDLTPIPKLGRPFAYSPNFRADGSVVFRDFVQDNDIAVYRTREWDQTSEQTRTLSRSKEELLGLQLGSDGRLLFLRNNETGDDVVVVENAKGKQRSFRLDGDGAGYLGWGRDHIAATANAADASFGEQATGTVFIAIDTGEQQLVPGWQPIAWNGDGTKVLARSTADLTRSELAFLDPRNPAAPERLGVLPALAIYFGSWMRGT